MRVGDTSPPPSWGPEKGGSGQSLEDLISMLYTKDPSIFNWPKKAGFPPLIKAEFIQKLEDAKADFSEGGKKIISDAIDALRQNPPDITKAVSLLDQLVM